MRYKHALVPTDGSVNNASFDESNPVVDAVASIVDPACSGFSGEKSSGDV